MGHSNLACSLTLYKVREWHMSDTITPSSEITYICKNHTYMTVKLTLSINKAVVQKAKTFARRTGRSLSGLIQSHLESLIREEDASGSPLPPKLARLAGIAKIPVGLDHKKEIRRIISAHENR